jgi:hypothetical protein
MIEDYFDWDQNYETIYEFEEFNISCDFDSFNDEHQFLNYEHSFIKS